MSILFDNISESVAKGALPQNQTVSNQPPSATELHAFFKKLLGLHHHCLTGDEVARAIESYGLLPQGSKLGLLVEVLDKDFTRAQVDDFFNQLVHHANKIAEGQRKPLLENLMKESNLLELTREEAAIVICNGILVRFPSSKLAVLNMNKLFSEDVQAGGDHVKKEKIRCLISYLLQVWDMDSPSLNEKITYRKFTCTTDPEWYPQVPTPIMPINVLMGMSIDDVPGCAQVNFGNTLTGGGVLSGAVLQEEIRFITCPELLLAMILLRESSPDDAYEVKNFRQFSLYTGYSHTFKFVSAVANGAFAGPRTLLSMDATRYCPKRGIHPDAQYEHQQIIRELHKAWVAFSNTEAHTIATGNWGCGSFGGDVMLKARIQILAASKAGKKLIYTTLNDSELAMKLIGLNDIYRGMSIYEAFSEMTIYALQKRRSLGLQDAGSATK